MDEEYNPGDRHLGWSHIAILAEICAVVLVSLLLYDVIQAARHGWFEQLFGF
jgi:hypothetical protein